MTVTLNLNPELEAGLFAQAQASGTTVQKYLLSVIESAVLPAGQHTLSAEERAKEFDPPAGHSGDLSPWKEIVAAGGQ